ncbi:histidine phosphatase family protein [Bifidobacterium crudilactis]|uniref:histidine phosphatase family protein n=1 Tax=Bifidobacterium crudilactis TaxID=327277 RepID=UPI002F35289D|nr:histidine phosphatase family protein [Bifidobacterium crudilactis]
MLLHLHLVRHGQTMFNRYNRLQGWSNSPLTSQGMQDARRAGEKLADVSFAAAYCSDTTRAEITARTILSVNLAGAGAANGQPEVHADMHFREQCYGYFEVQDMAASWWAAGAPHGVGTYNAIVERYGLSASRDFLHEADPFHDAESDAEYWRRIEGGFAVIAANGRLTDGDDVLVISHGNTLLSLMHRYAPDGYDLSERPRNGSVTTLEFDTAQQIGQALTVVGYNE